MIEEFVYLLRTLLVRELARYHLKKEENMCDRKFQKELIAKMDNTLKPEKYILVLPETTLMSVCQHSLKPV
jgi:hypothetical protein